MISFKLVKIFRNHDVVLSSNVLLQRECVFSFSIRNSWVFEEVNYSELSTGIKVQKEQLLIFVLV